MPYSVAATVIPGVYGPVFLRNVCGVVLVCIMLCDEVSVNRLKLATFEGAAVTVHLVRTLEVLLEDSVAEVRPFQNRVGSFETVFSLLSKTKIYEISLTKPNSP